MKLSELISAVGDDRIMFQMLSENVLNVQLRKRDAEVTFVTSLNNGTSLFGFDKDTETVGMVLWIPRKHLPPDFQKL